MKGSRQASRARQRNLDGKGAQPPNVASARRCPWLRLNPKLLYVDELVFVFYLLFIDVTEERHVVPFHFLYEAELDDSRTTTRLTTVLFQRSSSTLVASGVRLSGVQFPSCCRCLRLSGCNGTVGLPNAVLLHSCLNGGRSLPRFPTGSTLWKARTEGGTTAMHRCRLRSHPRVRSVIDSIQTRLDLVGNIWSSCEPLVQLAQSLLSVGRALD